ncbi:TPA: DUF551 domain-containing protein [Klebsiella aerogenes]
MNSVRLARDNAERADNRVDHSFYFALTIALQELQERRKADREPVGYFGRFDPDDEDLIDQCSKNVKGAFPLYRHAQPAPVVMVDLLGMAASAIEDLLEHTDPNTNYYSGVWADVPGKLRDALLQAEPVTSANKLGNSPVIPDTWIPVRERMPEDEQEVLTINRMGHRFVSFFDKHSGLFFDRLDAPSACCIEHVLVTHWMELPAAPQEVKP